MIVFKFGAIKIFVSALETDDDHLVMNSVGSSVAQLHVI
jgi:hypothetical protein